DGGEFEVRQGRRRLADGEARVGAALQQCYRKPQPPGDEGNQGAAETRADDREVTVDACHGASAGSRDWVRFIRPSRATRPARPGASGETSAMAHRSSSTRPARSDSP